MVKREVRFLGIDDSPFTFDQERTRIVGVVTRGAAYVEGVLSSTIGVDGADATQALVEMVTGTRFRPMLRAVFLNGVTLGGFNVVDLGAFHDAVGIPVVAVVRAQPDMAASERALTKHFPNAAERGARLRAQAPIAVQNGKFQVWVAARGIAADDVATVLELATVRGAVPEPLRLAHVIASGIQRGESRGPV